MVADPTGAPWRDLPERYRPWDRAYDLFRRWQRDGTSPPRCATRYDKLAVRYEATVLVAAINEWL